MNKGKLRSEGMLETGTGKTGIRGTPNSQRGRGEERGRGRGKKGGREGGRGREGGNLEPLLGHAQ